MDETPPRVEIRLRPRLGDGATAAFRALATALAAWSASGRSGNEELHSEHVSEGDLRLDAAARVLVDLARLGWNFSLDNDDVVATRTQDADQGGDEARRTRVRDQELLKRDEQLQEPAARAFVQSMERRRPTPRGFVSIFSLMRDGRALSGALGRLRGVEGGEREARLASLIDPYLQVVEEGARCAQTGLDLREVWAYFRRTWANQYVSTPGRSMMFLVRDRAAPFHPVVGIGQLSSAIVQLRERDAWIGWLPAEFLERARSAQPAELVAWLRRVTETAASEIWIDDLIAEEVVPIGALIEPTEAAITGLNVWARAERERHHRFTSAGALKSRVERDESATWEGRARTHLFRSKRALALADVLAMRLAVAGLRDVSTARDVDAALNNPVIERGVLRALRKAKKDQVGIAMADISVCGAVAPYNSLLGGKLVSMLAASPQMVEAYRARYSEAASEIASAMAGRVIARRPELVLLGTTSLYGVGLNQYTRVRVPPEVLGDPYGEGVRFVRLGNSRAYGTSQFSAATVDALVRVVERERGGVRVNSLFGEGVSPKLRKIREGLDLIGLPADALLQHGRARVVYGVKLAENSSGYLMGMEAEPRYLFSVGGDAATARIADYWRKRWLAGRIDRDGVLEEVAQHATSVRPVRHGARVKLPPLSGPAGGPEQLDWFSDLE